MSIPAMSCLYIINIASKEFVAKIIKLQRIFNFLMISRGYRILPRIYVSSYRNILPMNANYYTIRFFCDAFKFIDLGKEGDFADLELWVLAMYEPLSS